MRRLYQLLLYAYPPSLRRTHGAEMADAVDDAWREARRRGGLAPWQLVARVLTDFVRCWPQAWRGTPAAMRRAPKESLMSTSFWLTLKFTGRLLRRHPASTIATLLTLTLAIGLNTAVFSVVHAVLFQPLPYGQPAQLVRIWEHNLVRGNDRNVVSPANYLEWQDRATSFSGIATFGERRVTLTGDGMPEEVPSIGATWNLFEVLQVAPAMGRPLTAADGEPNAPPVAFLSWALWQRRYGGDPSVVGRMVSLNGRSTEVIGILPERFTFFGDQPEVWQPLSIPAAARIPRGRSLQVVARLNEGVSPAAAQTEMTAIADALREQWKDFNAGWTVRVVPVIDDMVGPSRPVLLLLLAAVAVVLLVGCANTANLLLARASDRRRELSVRAAVGASRRNLFVQLLTEGAVLAVLGAIGGVALAVTTLRLVSARLGEVLDVPRLGEATLNPTVLLFTLGLMALCALLFSVLPAAHLTDAASSLVTDGRAPTGTRRDRRIRQALVVSQLALAVVLVVTGGLVARSLAKLTAVDPGFNPSGILTFSLSLPALHYTSPDAVRFFDTLATRLETLPGVTRAAGNAWLPFTGFGGATSFTVVGDPPPTAAERPVADIRPVTDGYFDVMGLAIREGRGFTPQENHEPRRVVVVNEALVRQLFAGREALGRRLAVNWGNTPGEDEIVGVVADSKLGSLTDPTRPMIYYPLAASPVSAMTMVVKTDGAPLGLARSAESLVREMDPNLPLTRVRTMEQILGGAVATPAVASWLVLSFAALTLVLALVGLAGLQAATVAARVPEFGVRLALGATPAGLRRFVLREGGALIGVGVVIGAALALFVTRLVAQQLYDVTATDPLVFAGAMAVVALLSLLAADVPARRATRVDAARVLRS